MGRPVYSGRDCVMRGLWSRRVLGGPVGGLYPVGACMRDSRRPIWFVRGRLLCSRIGKTIRIGQETFLAGHTPPSLQEAECGRVVFGGACVRIRRVIRFVRAPAT